MGADTLPERILAELKLQYQTKENVWKENGIDMRLVEKQIMLQLLDQRWKEHLATMDQLRQEFISEPTLKNSRNKSTNANRLSYFRTSLQH